MYDAVKIGQLPANAPRTAVHGTLRPFGRTRAKEKRAWQSTTATLPTLRAIISHIWSLFSRKDDGKRVPALMIGRRKSLQLDGSPTDISSWIETSSRQHPDERRTDWHKQRLATDNLVAES